MRAFWSTHTNKLVIEGVHKAGTPRRWLVSLWAKIPHDDGTVETVKWTIRPSLPVLVSDLADIIEEELNQHPGKTAAGWTATAR